MTIVLLTALGVGGASVIGAVLGFVFKKISHKFSDIVLGFAAGVMLAAAIIGLILPSLEYGGKIPLVVTVLGIFCGLLMYIAVFGFAKSNKPIFIIMPVAFFILCGFNHCVADMFYLSVGCTKFIELLPLIPTTLGNIIGCNMIPFFLWINEKMRTT